MSRSIFGWDLPPGCTQRDIDSAFGEPAMPPCCEKCKVDTCDKPEECEEYKKALIQEEEFCKEENKYYEEMFKEQ